MNRLNCGIALRSRLLAHAKCRSTRGSETDPRDRMKILTLVNGFFSGGPSSVYDEDSQTLAFGTNRLTGLGCHLSQIGRKTAGVKQNTVPLRIVQERIDPVLESVNLAHDQMRIFQREMSHSARRNPASFDFDRVNQDYKIQPGIERFQPIAKAAERRLQAVGAADAHESIRTVVMEAVDEMAENK